MIQHYWKIAVRTIRRQLVFSVINIMGLSIGVAACLLIYLYVHNELSYDAYHPLAARIARVTTVLHSPESNLDIATCPAPLAAVLLRDYPEVQSVVRIEQPDIVVRQDNEASPAKGFCYSEQSIFSVFSFSFVEGSSAGALSAPHSIVLSRSMARKYCGNKPALGRILVCNGQNYRVTAVIADRPSNSDLTINALLSKDYSLTTRWMDDDFETYTFVLFRQKPDLRRFDERMAGLGAKYIQPELEQQGATGYHVRFASESLADVHFSKGKLADTPKGNRQFNRVFSSLAAFILVIALLNYINLANARVTERMKEVGVRKVIGARPGQLVRQFLGESSLLVAIAWLVAIGLVEAGIPLFNKVLATRLSFGGWPAVLFPLLLFPLTILLAGGYPAFVLARLQPIFALKGSLGRQINRVSLRKILTVVQFVLALVMLAGAVIFYNQMQYISHKDLGVDRAQVVCMEIPADSTARAGAPAFFQALRREAGISGVTVGSGLPTEGVAMSSTTARSNGKEKHFMCNYFFIDPQLLPLLHISLVAGRNISDSFPTDKKDAVLVNEAFVAVMEWKSPLGQSVQGGFDDRKGRVVGVVKNFIWKSLHNPIEPMVMIYRTDPPMAVLVKTTIGEIPRLKQLWKNNIPSRPFDCSFMDEDFEQQYVKDRTELFLFNAFTGLAVFISCLGLYGLVSLITVRRTREIGVRKVIGASPFQLAVLLSKELVYLIGWAALIALPLAAIGAHRWLSSYAYHTSVTAWMFAAPVAIILVLALAVTGYRILRAVIANPAESLRAE
jgi:putative ABC transport system permease protein